MKLEINDQTYWLDFDKWKANEEFNKEQERKYWEYHFSGQRTIDIFGIEGAKRILEEQNAREFNSRHTKKD